MGLNRPCETLSSIISLSMGIATTSIRKGSSQTFWLDTTETCWGGSTTLLIASSSYQVREWAYSPLHSIPRKDSFDFQHNMLQNWRFCNLTGVNDPPLTPCENLGINYMLQGPGNGITQQIAHSLQSAPKYGVSDSEKGSYVTFLGTHL